MKNLIYILFILVYPMAAQVGIGTVNPQKELHIAGENGTIRIDQFNSTNSPLYNDGVNLAPVYVDGKGSFTLGNGSSSSGNAPFDFLIEDTNFIDDDPYNVSYDTGIVVNSGVGSAFAEGIIDTEVITLTQTSIVEVKFGVTILVEGSDLSLGPPYTDLAYNQAIVLGLYFCVDQDGVPGLSPAEAAEKYALNGQYYMTIYGGIQGYIYLNSDGYLSLPEGSHTVYFFGTVEDNTANYTSVGFGGYKDYLKIRIYN